MINFEENRKIIIAPQPFLINETDDAMSVINHKN